MVTSVMVILVSKPYFFLVSGILEKLMEMFLKNFLGVLIHYNSKYCEQYQ